MNMKNTVILLIFLLSIMGLLIGVYYSEDLSNEKAHEGSFEKVYEDNDGVLTITLKEKEQNKLTRFFTWIANFFTKKNK